MIELLGFFLWAAPIVFEMSPFQGLDRHSDRFLPMGCAHSFGIAPYQGLGVDSDGFFPIGCAHGFGIAPFQGLGVDSDGFFPMGCAHGFGIVPFRPGGYISDFISDAMKRPERPAIHSAEAASLWVGTQCKHQ